MDDESRSEKPVDRTFSSKNLAPQQWDIADNPQGDPEFEKPWQSLFVAVPAHRIAPLC